LNSARQRKKKRGHTGEVELRGRIKAKTTSCGHKGSSNRRNRATWMRTRIRPITIWVPTAFAATHPWIKRRRRRRRRSWLSCMAKRELEKAPDFAFWLLGLWLFISYCHFGRTIQRALALCPELEMQLLGFSFCFWFGATFEWVKSPFGGSKCNGDATLCFGDTGGPEWGTITELIADLCFSQITFLIRSYTLMLHETCFFGDFTTSNLI